MTPINPVTLGDLHRRKVNLWAWCNDCSHNRELPLPALIARFGSGQTAAGVAAWARCSACGSRRVETRPAYQSQGVVSSHRWKGRPGPAADDD